MKLIHRSLLCLLAGWLALAPLGAGMSLDLSSDQRVLRADTNERAFVRITLRPEVQQTTNENKRPPVNLAIVLDRSGSMSGSKIERAKEGALEAIRRLGEQDIISFVTYSSDAVTEVSATPANNLTEIMRRIRGIRSGGGTALYAGMNLGVAELRKHLDGDYFHRVVLLSDGLANEGPSGTDDFVRLGRALQKEGVSVSTVGIGTDYNEDLMVGLAKTAQGNTYFAENSRDLSNIFQREVGDVMNVVAKKIIVHVQCPEGIRPIRVLGRDGVISGNEIRFEINQLYGGQDEYAYLELDVPPTTEGEVRDLLNVNVAYEDTIKKEKSKVSGSLAASFSQDEQVIQSNVDQVVAKDRSVLYQTWAQEQAIALSDQGRTQEAAQMMRDVNHQVSVWNATIYLNSEIEDIVNEYEGEAQEVEQQGIDNSKRKILKSKIHEKYF